MNHRLYLVVCLLVASCSAPAPDTDEGDAAAAVDARADADVPRGLRQSTDGVSPGYVLFSPLLSDTTYLIDNDGNVVHTWKSNYAPSGGLYLLDNGNLVRGARIPGDVNFKGGGQGGRIEEYTWDGELVWDYAYASEEHLLHHDIEPLPDGNFLAIAWESKSADEVRASGRREEWTPEAGLWPDTVVELEPVRPDGARVVWEWHAWDHTVQNVSPDLENYGEPSEYLGRIDVNAGGTTEQIDPEQLEQLKALGYVPPDATEEDIGSDWMHTNAVAYNAALDQIAISINHFSEIWILDHSTTTEEARGSAGGRWGKGGDLLYRWGNPAIYGRGDESAQRLFAQHDVRWIPDGHRGAGRLLIFNNDVPGAKEEENHSRIVEIAAPVDADGRYVVPAEGPFGPAEPDWIYEAPDKTSFYSPFISGATRLPNGNTLICSGAQGRFLEIDPNGEIVWEYWTPYSGKVRNPDGTPPHPVGEFTYAVFRATRISPDHPALAGRTLAPLDPQPAPVAADDLAEER